MADMDTDARGFMPANPDFVKCLLSGELDFGLSAREADKLVGALLKLSTSAGTENMVRYGDRTAICTKIWQQIMMCQ